MVFRSGSTDLHCLLQHVRMSSCYTPHQYWVLSALSILAILVGVYFSLFDLYCLYILNTITLSVLQAVIFLFHGLLYPKIKRAIILVKSNFPFASRTSSRISFRSARHKFSQYLSEKGLDFHSLFRDVSLVGFRNAR